MRPGHLLSSRRFAIKAAALALAVSAVAASTVGGADGEERFAQLAGEEAEQFLRHAKVIERENLPVGVTHPQRVTLIDGRQTARAVWKTVNIYRHRYRLRDGRAELGFRDSYKHEIAAYELDKLLGLNMVPPTVHRRLGHEWGSLQLWVENSMSETERRERGMPLPDVRRWNEQIHTVRLIRQLLDDSDFNNISNVLLDADFHVWAIDHSRAFRLGRKLREPRELRRFSRTVLRKLGTLDEEVARERLGPWLTRDQIRALLLRRDLILERADLLVAEKGEEAVLFP